MYETVDEIIQQWVNVHKFTLFDRFGDQLSRCVYLSSADGECCQIWIDPPVGEEICLHIGDVETKNDQEMQMDWQVPISRLPEALENAVASVRQWFDR